MFVETDTSAAKRLADTSQAFCCDHSGGEDVGRGNAAGGDGATAVNHVSLDIADKLVYLFVEAPYEAARN